MLSNKKKVIFLSGLTILMFISLFVIVQAIDYNDAWHPLDQISEDGNPSGPSVDTNSDGRIDEAEDSLSCSLDGTCEMSSGDVSNNLNVGGVLNLNNNDIRNVRAVRFDNEETSNVNNNEANLMWDNSKGLMYYHNGNWRTILSNYDSMTDSLDVKFDKVEAQTFEYYSDERLKRNIRSVENPLKRLSNIKGVSFDWKDSGEESVGLIAQDVEEEFPELVSTGEDGMKSVQYGNMVAVLTEAVKEQQKEIDDLEKQINALQKEIDEMKDD